jgi:hypothetical protein
MVSVIVPLNEDGAERSRHWRWLRRRLEVLHPGMEIIEAECPGPDWVKGRAIQAGVERATGDTIVMMDADVFVSQDALNSTIEIAQSAPWAVPHTMVHRLGRYSTLELTERAAATVVDYDPAGQVYARQPHKGVAGGGIVALSRTAYNAVGPPDTRFVGWGGEDTSWRRALDTMVGPHHRGDADMIHLWHPPQAEQQNPSQAARRLAKRYRVAVWKPEAMSVLLKEAADVL